VTDYIEVSIEVNTLYTELVSEIISSYGFDELILTEEHFSENSLELNSNHLKVYIPDLEDNKKIIEAIKADLKEKHRQLKKDNISETLTGSWKISIKIIKDEDWSENWKKYWHPLRIGKNFIICPSWETCSIESPDDVIIIIDPGSAFGTGTHATTRLCLCAIEKVLSNNKAPQKALDVGTGSGILAIAAAKKGIINVKGIDIDPVAIQVATENAKLNGIDQYCSFNTLSIRNLNTEYDLIIVNILAKTILSMSEDIKRLTKRQGYIILSGIISEKIDEIINHFQSSGYNIVENISEENWHAIIAQRV
jgi:ribosomal protein L11 methyltransferase